MSKKRERAHGNTRHGHCPADKSKRTPTYRTWDAMRRRCSNPNDARYADYGGRGITISNAWESFVQFLADMGERPAGMQLDRIDNNGPYSKDNCRWASRVQNMRNTRRARLVTFKGTTKPLCEWAEEIGINHMTLRSRLYQYGWPVERALSEGVRTW